MMKITLIGDGFQHRGNFLRLPLPLSWMIIFHIGLPKTATSFLQYQIFPFIEGINFVHRRASDTAMALSKSLNTISINRAWPTGEKRRRIVKQVIDYTESTDRGQNLLISDENISIRADRFWTSAGEGPEVVARRLAELGEDLSTIYPTMRVMIGIRRQDQWLASRYAESSKLFPHFDQADFERRMNEIVDSGELSRALLWLDYDVVHRTFSELIGTENVLMLPMERLFREPVQTMGEMGEFLGCRDLVELYDRVHQKAPDSRMNKLSTGENSWKMRRDGSALHLSLHLQTALRGRFAASSRELSKRTPLGFEI